MMFSELSADDDDTSGLPLDPLINQPKKDLVQAVWDDDVKVVDEWISYLKYNPCNEKGEKIIDMRREFYNPLQAAVQSNNVNLLEKLIQAKADPKCCTSEKMKNPPLVLAASMLCESLFREETTAQPTADNTDGCLKSEASPEKIGAETKHKTSFHTLLQEKVEVNACNFNGVTALHVACSRGNTVMVKELLLMPEIDVDREDSCFNTPVHAACVGGNKYVVESLIEHGANFLKTNHQGMLPFHVAVVENHLEVVKMILTSDKLVEHREHFLQEKVNGGHSAFLLAVKAGEVMMVRALLDTGLVSITDKNSSEANVFHLAAAINKELIMHMIFEYDSENAKGLLNEKDSSGCTPLHCAAKHDQSNALTFAIKRSDNIEQKDSDKMTPLLAAVASDNIQTTQILIESGADVTVIDRHNKNVVHFAVDNGAVEMLKIFLDHDVAMKLINTRDNQGLTPLHKACTLGNYKIVEELLKKGAKVAIRDSSGSFPLHCAANKGHLEIVKLLENNGADIDVVNEASGATPLTVAAENGQERIVDFLLKSGANVNGNIFPDWNTTPLIAASLCGHVGIIKLLLDNGADVNFLDSDNEYGYHNAQLTNCNCLVVAILQNHEDAARTIIESECWKDAMKWYSQGDKCYTPMDLLIENMPDVARIVLNKCITKESTGRVICDYEFLMKKNVSALETMIDNERIELLNHPLITKFLNFQWRKAALPSYLMLLLPYLVFLSFLTAFALSSPTPRSDELADYNCTASDNDDCKENYNQSFLRGAAVIIILFAALGLCIELLQFYVQRRYYFSLDNLVDTGLYICSIIFVSYGLQSGCQCPESWQWQFGALTLLLAWLDLVLFLKQFPHTGVYVVMFVNILRTFLKVILLSILFVISFGITFYMIFYRPGMRSPFSSPFRSLIKTMVMTTGELDFDDIFFNSQEDADEGNNLFYPQIAYLVWIVFIILMPIILTNLLVGLAVDDIKGIQDKADLKHLNLMVSLIQRAVIHSDSIEVVECQNEDRKQSLINQILYQRDSYLQKAKRYFFELRKDDGRLKDDAYPLSSTEEIKKEIAELKMLIKDMKLKDNSDQSSREIEQNKKLDEHLKQMSFKSADEVKTKFIAVDEPAKTEEYTLDGISGSSNSSEVDK